MFKTIIIIINSQRIITFKFLHIKENKLHDINIPFFGVYGDDKDDIDLS